MNALDLVNMMKASGAQLTLTPGGRLRVLGDPAAIERALPIVAQYQEQLTEALINRRLTERTTSDEIHTQAV